MAWDLFISHASEDKDDVARPLADRFIKQGLSVWYDEYTLTVGDSLRRCIDRGLAGCRYGLVILSPHFLQKEWTQKELDGLVVREDGTEKRILPVWHNVKRTDIVEFSPPLADKLGVSTAKGLDHVVKEIMRVFQIASSKTPAQSPAPLTRQRAQKPNKAKKPAGRQKSDILVMIDRFFFPAASVQQSQDGTFTVKVVPTTAEQEADLEALHSQRHGSSVPFAARNDAYLVRMKGAEKDLSGKRAMWTLTLAPEDRGFGNGTDMTYNEGGKSYTPTDIARLRACRLLLNDPPSETSDQGGFGRYSMLEGAVAGSGKYQVRNCLIPTMYARYGQSSSWREMARLQAIFFLKATGTVDHVLALTIGPVRGGKVAVNFRGRRKARYDGHEPIQIEASGSCSVK